MKWPTLAELQQIEAELISEATVLGFDLRHPPTTAGTERDAWLAKLKELIAQRKPRVSAEFRAKARGR